MGLTEPQERLLKRVRDLGVLKQNGRARRTVEALEAAGLVEYDYDLVPYADGRYTEEFTIRPVWWVRSSYPTFEPERYVGLEAARARLDQIRDMIPDHDRGAYWIGV